MALQMLVISSRVNRRVDREEDTDMVMTGLRILVGMLVVAALLGLGVLEIITARPRFDHVLTELGNPGDEGPGPRLDFLGFDEGDKR
jgi:hypothetical protein